MKNILITGAGRNIGFAAAKAVESLAKNLILVTKSKKSFKRLEKSFPNARSFCVDLSDEKQALKFADKMRKEFACLDVLVNNAGFYIGKKFEKTSTRELDRLYKIHLKAPFLLMQRLLPLLKKSKCPQIINISSAANFARLPGESAYTAVKAGLAALGDVLRDEMQKYKIRLTNIYPWTVARDLKNSKKFLKPEDIGKAIAFIISTDKNCQIMNMELSAVSDWRGGWPPWIKK